MLRQTLIIIAFTCVINSVLSQKQEFTNNDILEQKISLSINAITLDKAFDQLSKQTNYYFTYNASQIDGEKIVTLNIAGQPLKKVLDTLLQNSSFSYQLVNNQIVIHKFAGYITNGAVQKNASILISGKIVDANSGEALPFASIVVKNSYYGVIANELGLFAIKIPAKFVNDTLAFSFMGYYNKEIPINDQKDMVVELLPGMVSLQEVIIRNGQPLQLLKKARELLKQNYYSKAYNYTAFYREAVKQNSRYMIYAEALIEGYKASILTENSNNKVQLIKSRRFTDIQQTDTLLVKLRGGMEACFQLDLIHQLPDFLAENGENFYDYYINDIIVWHDELVYVIDFKQKKYIQEALFEGSIYLSVNTYAIVGASFSFSKDQLRKTGNIFVIKKSRQVNIKPVKTLYQVQYGCLNGKYFTHHVRGELTFKVKKRRQVLGQDYSTMMEMVYSKIDTLNVKKPLREDLFKTHTIFSDLNYVYDQTFWSTNNVIRPEDDILDAFKKSGFQLIEEGMLEE